MSYAEARQIDDLESQLPNYWGDDLDYFILRSHRTGVGRTGQEKSDV
jgi:hypothetical protein